MSLEPLRRMAPKRCPREKGSMPACTFWNALSGQLEKNRITALFVLVLGLKNRRQGVKEVNLTCRYGSRWGHRWMDQGREYGLTQS